MLIANIYPNLNTVNQILLLCIFYLLYKIIRQYFDDKRKSQIKPISLKDDQEKLSLTPKELQIYNGEKQSPIFIAIRGNIYDVTRAHQFYGPGGPYAIFAGKDASRGLAKNSTEEKDVFKYTAAIQIDNLEDLTKDEVCALLEWESHFQFKYPVIGQLEIAPKIAKS